MPLNPLVALPYLQPPPSPTTTYLSLTPHTTRLLTHALSTAPPSNHFPNYWAQRFSPASTSDPRSRIAMLPPHLLRQRRHSSAINSSPTFPPPDNARTTEASPRLCHTHDLLAPPLISSIHAFVTQELDSTATLLSPLLVANTADQDLVGLFCTLLSLIETLKRGCQACALAQMGADPAAVLVLRVVMVARMVLRRAAVRVGTVGDAAVCDARFAWVDAWVRNIFSAEEVARVVEGTGERGLCLAVLLSGMGGSVGGEGGVSPTTKVEGDGDSDDGGDDDDDECSDGEDSDEEERARKREKRGVKQELNSFRWPMRASPTWEDRSLAERRRRRWGAETRAEWYRREIYGGDDEGWAMFGGYTTPELTPEFDFGADYDDPGYESGEDTPETEWERCSPMERC